MPSEATISPKYNDRTLIDWLLDKHPDLVVAATIRLAKRLTIHELADEHKVAKEIRDIIDKLHAAYILEEYECAMRTDNEI